ncbi:MAG TPA: glycosyltransferase family 9 protein [Opitutus sp.]|nr:glycosyltransferase family 9 protein [Opitutus sp.]
MNILVSKPDALGDQILATGFIQSLRHRWPDARIVWHVRAGMEIIARLVADASVFTPDPAGDPTREAGRLWNESTTPIVVVPHAIHPYTDWAPGLDQRFKWWGDFLRASRWDLAIAPVVNRTGLTDFTVTASAAARRVVFAANGACQPMIEAAFAHLPEKKAGFTDEISSSLQESEWSQLARLLETVAPGESLRPPALTVPLSASGAANQRLGDAHDLILIAPGVGANRQRAWPMANFLQLASELRTHGRDIRWIEGPHDAGYFADLPESEAPARLKFDAQQLDVLAAAIGRAALLVCNDTAYVHLAATLGTPTVAIFGAGQKDRFAPRFGRVHVVQGDPACRGCQWQCMFDRHFCVQDIPLAAVSAAVDAQLAAAAPAHERLALSLPLDPPAHDATEELGRARDWFQEELDRLRWDGWARLQIVNDVLQRVQARDRRIAELEKRVAAVPPVLPRLSVIIPMGRPERADGTLQSLRRQTLRPPDWEVVIVGVGASQLPAKYPDLPIVPVDLEHNVLPPRTRVEGVRRASGDWFVFVDDDIQLAPDFFEMLARVFAVDLAPSDQPHVGAIGVRLPGGRGTFFEKLTDISNFWSQQSPIRAVPHTVWFLYSATFVIRAEAYRKSGGFNPELPNGEDVDLTQRIKAAGYLLAYEPSLVAFHHHGRDSLFRMWRYFWRNGNAAQQFFGHFGGVCCYSLRTVLVRAWLDLRMNRNFQRTQGVRLGAKVPWILLNYLIVESSLEWHYQQYLWVSKKYTALPARTASDQNAVKAFTARADHRPLAAFGRYVLAMLQNLTDPVRR